MLSPTQAAEAASTHLKELFPSAENILLEELELSDDDAYWLVTLSYLDSQRREAAAIAPAMDMLGAGGKREYKLVKINANTGEVRALRTRKRL